MSPPSSAKVHSSVMTDQPGEKGQGTSQTFTTSKKDEQSCAFSRMITTSDVGILILRFLPRSDLNTFALVSKECHYVRNQPELDQTREASIVLKTDLFKVYPAGALHNSFESAGHGDLLLIVNFATKWIRDLNSKPQITELRIHILRSDLPGTTPRDLRLCYCPLVLEQIHIIYQKEECKLSHRQ